MRHFMAGFFIVFSFFKLLDPPGFVSAYRGYDLVARRVPAWGWAYPFVELALGVAYLLAWAPVVTNIITLVLMLVGAGGVLKALLNKRAIRLAILVFKVIRVQIFGNKVYCTHCIYRSTKHKYKGANYNTQVHKKVFFSQYWLSLNNIA